MKNLYVLPTDKPSKLIYNDANDLCYQSNKSAKNDRKWMYRKKFHIYITSDEDINENDYIITKDGRLIQVDYLLSKDLEEASKVILTTDQDLIKDGVQAISDEFLRWFVKNPSCDKVEVVDDTYTVGEMSKLPLGTRNHKYKIIIPQKETNQETLEEAAERLYQYQSENPPYTIITPKAKIEGFIDGAKWQAERIPSIIEEYLETAFISKEQGYMNPKEWFEQFKK
jgi:hypothetical protein